MSDDTEKSWLTMKGDHYSTELAAAFIIMLSHSHFFVNHMETDRESSTIAIHYTIMIINISTINSKWILIYGQYFGRLLKFSAHS